MSTRGRGKAVEKDGCYTAGLAPRRRVSYEYTCSRAGNTPLNLGVNEDVREVCFMDELQKIEIGESDNEP